MSNPSCLFCGAGSANIALASMPPKYPFKCGSYESYRSDLCREREAHNNTKAELNIERGIAQKACLEIARLERERNEWRITASSLKAGESELLKENAKLRDIAERAIKYGEQNHKRSCDAISYGIACDCDCGIEALRAELDKLKEGAK